MTAALREVVAGDGNLCGPTSVLLRDPDCDKRNRSSGSLPSSPTSIAAASYFDGLAEEELVEILRRLPLKLATQCKSVSKNWLNLISSNHFARSYLHSINAPPQFTLVNRYAGFITPGMFRETPSSSSDGLVKLTTPEDIIPEDIIPDQGRVGLQFLAASNGWVLCSYPYRSREIYYVVDPLTKHLITLPPIPRTSEKFCRVGFVFINPFCADSKYSNRANLATSGFRVVRFPPTNNIPDNTMKLDIFSSETGQWTQSTLSFSSARSAKWSDRYDGQLNYHAVACNGKLHWLRVWFALEIFVYDPYEPEKYQRLSLPEDCGGEDRHCLGTSHCQGQSHLKYWEWTEGVVCVWELKDYDKVEWCLLHRVHVSEMTFCVSVIYHPDVVAFHPWDRDLVMCHHAGRFLQCNLRLKTLEAFLEQGQQIKSRFCMTRAFFLFELPWWPTPVPPPYSN